MADPLQIIITNYVTATNYVDLFLTNYVNHPVTSVVEKVVSHEVTNEVVRLMEPAVVSGEPDWWSRASALITLLIGLYAVYISSKSLEHSRRVSENSATFNAKTMTVQLAGMADQRTFNETALSKQIEATDHQIEHDLLTSAPHLTSVYGPDNSSVLNSIKMCNYGLGPALIQRPKLYYDDIFIAEMTMENLPLIRKTIKCNDGVMITAVDASRLCLGADKHIELFWVNPQLINKGEANYWLTQNKTRIKISVEYESIYGEKKNCTYKMETAVS